MENKKPEKENIIVNEEDIFETIEEIILDHEDVSDNTEYEQEIKDIDFIPPMEKEPKETEISEHIIPSETLETNPSEEFAKEYDKVFNDHVLEEQAKNIEKLKEKAQSIKIGKYITIIYDDKDKQKVLNSKLLSLTNTHITVSDENDINKLPKSIPFSNTIDVFEVKRVKKNKKRFSVFNLNKRVKEFFVGTEEERKEVLESKIKEKDLKEKLKK